MSMTINLVEDHNIYLCEGGPVYNGGVQPTPITYLTQWKIVGNSEVHDNEIWSCGEYNPIDGKYHILVQPQGGSIADIALTEPLRKYNVADTIEFPSGIEGKALVTRYFVSYQIKDFEYSQRSDTTNCHRIRTLNTLDTINYDSTVLSNTLTVNFINKTLNDANNASEGYYVASYNQYLMFYVPKSVSQSDFETTYGEDEILVELATPITELVDAPQIQEAEGYTCVITPGGKAVSWSEFLYYSGYLLTDSENNILVDSENNQLTVQS